MDVHNDAGSDLREAGRGSSPGDFRASGAKSHYAERLATMAHPHHGRTSRLSGGPAFSSLIVLAALAISGAVAALSCRTTGSFRSLPGSVEGQDTFVSGFELYQAHCAACHGEKVGIMGPAAIALATPPRDFYQERFRYVSALDGVPTQDDLIQTIKSGRRFGEMPANPQLTDAEILTLTNYILEVHRLGWVDTLTLEFADDEDTTPEEIEEISQARITPLEPISVSGPERGFESDTQRGRTQYLASCASCHGPWGLGDGLDMPLDEQGKPIEVRDLTSGRFRSGAAIEEVFKRIRCGIPGTPMSAALDLTDEEVWQLVYYVRFLAKRSR